MAIKTLLEFAQSFKSFRVARFINIESNKTIQLSRYQMDQLIKTKKCYGKLCSEEYMKASNREFEIFNWNKPIWLLTWYKDESDDYLGGFDRMIGEQSPIQNNNTQIESIKITTHNHIKVPTYCPKCFSMISLVEYDGKQVVACSRYPKCDYIAME